MSDRYYLVTFDLVGAKGRTNDYPKVRSQLQLRFGQNNYFELLKQCAIINTIEDARKIRDTVFQITGVSSNVLVVRLRKGYAYRLISPQKRGVAKSVLSRIPG